jgi:hypothetical protein
MKEEKEWVHFSLIDWSDPKFNVFSIDTRDFHCGYRLNDKPHKDIATLKKYPDFFHTEEEVKTLIQRYFDESGGDKEWRYLSLEGYEDSWGLKYIRIWRNELGFIICDSNNRALKKSILSLPINQKYLH